MCASFALPFLIAHPAMAQSMADPSVRLGAATIAGIGTDTVRITQSSDKAVIDWRAFSIDAGSNVVFSQPTASAIALNRVTGATESRIDGSLLANGQVWLLNPNGVLIGAGGRVNAAGFVATTHALSDEDFAAGKNVFESTGTGARVVNFGRIVSSEGGYAILAGDKVGNAGLVQARLGQVALGAGKSFVLDMAGDKLLSFAITKPLSVIPTGGALVENIGVLSAPGGQVLLSARSAQDVVAGVINTSGLVDATSVYMKAGKIVLDGGDLGTVAVTGGLVASGNDADQSGGTINVLGHTVVIGDNALLDATGHTGGGQIHVGGGWQGASVDGHASAVRAAVAATAVLDASATGTGNGGEITLWSDVNNPGSMTIANGSFYARGGASGGNGGRIETSGRYLVTDGVRGSAAASIGSAGLWLFDPYNVEIVTAGIINPGFEQGTTAWTSLNGGTAQIVTTISANNGTYTSQISSGGNFAVVSGGSVNTQVGIQQVFQGTAGQTYTLYSNFINREGCTGCSFNDNGGVNLLLSGGNTTQLYMNNANSVGPGNSSGWNMSSFTLAQNGTYTIQAYGRNIGDSSVPPNFAFELAATSSVSTNGAFANVAGSQVFTPTGSPSKIDVTQITGFLNAGTNVQVTTGTAGIGGEAGNITVSAAIAKTSGAAATLQLDALGGIVVNQAISSSSNVLNVALNAGSGGIVLNAPVGTNGGGLTLNTPGSVTQSSAGAFNTNTLALNGTGGTYVLTNAGNRVTTVSADTGSVNLASFTANTRLANVTTTGELVVAAVSNLLLDNVVTVGGTSELKAGNAVTIGSAATINASADVSIIAGTNFINQSGSDAIAVSNGARWLVYSTAPGSNTFGDLASGNLALWGRGATTNPPASISETGNRYIFSTSPTVTLSATNARKTYGDVLDASSTRPYTVAGIVSAATYGNVFSQDVLTGTPTFSSAGDTARASVAGGPYGISIGRGSLALPGYGFAFASGTLTIDTKAIAALLTGSVSKTYDGDTTATLAAGNYALTGVVSGDAVALNNPTLGDYDTKNVGTAKLVSVAGLAISGADAGNYTVNTSTSAAIGVIGAKSLAATLTGSVSKTYDGDTTATLAAGNYALSGVVSGDAVTLNNPTLGDYDTRNVGMAKTVSVGGLALAGADAGNYTVNASTSAAIGAIDPKAIAATLTGIVSKTYDGGTAATLAAGNYALTGVVSGDAVMLNNPTLGDYDTKNVGTAKLVTVAGLAIGGADAGNYTVNTTANAAIGVIAAKSLAATLTGSVSKTYDSDTTATLAAGNYALTGVVSGDAVTLNNPTLGDYDTRNVGTAKLVTVGGLAISGADAGNYTVNASTSAAIGAIDPKAIAATLTGSVSKTYDGSTTATLAAGNYALSGVVSGDAVALNNPTLGDYDTRNVGIAKTVTVGGLAIGGADAGNYTVNTTANAAIGVIAAKSLAATLTGSVSKTYDGGTAATLAAGNYALTGVVSGDAVALNNPTAGNYETRNVGTAKLVTVGSLAISGADAGNYTVNTGTSAAIGVISAKSLAATLTGSVSKTYDGSTAATLAAGNYALSGVVSGDAVALNNPTLGEYDTKNVGTAKLVSVAGLAISGADAGNYTVNTQASSNVGRIDPRLLSIALTGSVSRIFNGGTGARLAPENYALTGFVSGESASITQTVGQYATATAGTGIAVSTTVSQAQFSPADGTALSNYVLPTGGVSGLVGTITPAAPQPQPSSAPSPAPEAPSDAAPPPPAVATPQPAATSSPAPVPEAPSGAPASGGGSASPASGGATAVEASPPSPVPSEKPPTPQDAADSGDPILATVDSSSSEKPAPNVTRSTSDSTPIAGGLLTSQRSLPPRSDNVPGLDYAFSASGNVF